MGVVGKALKLKIRITPSLGKMGTQKGANNTNTSENRIPVFQELTNESLMLLRRIHVI